MVSTDQLKDMVVIEAGGSPDEEKIHTDLSKLTEEVPEGHMAVINNKTGDVIDVGRLDDVMSQVLIDEDQMMDLDKGVSHTVKYHTLYNMFNSEPSINQALSLRSELPVAYGYTFQYPEMPSEFSSSASRGIAKISIPMWALWADWVNLNHQIRQSIHSLLGTGNLWIEKFYDNAGMNKRGWGVKGMRILSPDAMYNVIDKHNRIIGFVQWAGDTDRRFGDDMHIKDISKFKRQVKDLQEQAKKDKRLVPPDIVEIPRHKILYWNYNAYYDDTVYGYGSAVPLISYARSKVGVQKRVLRMIENSASSFVVFKYGTENYMVSGATAKKIFKNVKSKNHLKYVLLPFYFEPKEVELGGKMQNVMPYLDYFRDEEVYGAGLPPFAFGKGGSSEGAMMQMEMLVRQMKYMQSMIGTEFRRQMFAEVVVGNPKSSRVIVTEPPHEYPYMTPAIFTNLPELRWKDIESIADRRLRHEVYMKHGAMSIEEIRAEMGYTGTLTDDQLPPLVKKEVDMIAQTEKQIDQEGKRIDLEDSRRGEEIEVAKEGNQISRIQASKPGNGSSANKP
jgi:hypothetical protein